ncbi:MAG: peptide ABC transporter substrate-binding protein [Anaerolineae bacterium]|nr:peptide ABC transporter substrate-binding protein [Anaerolineae bacterium]
MPRSSRLAALLTICGIVLIGVVLARQVVHVSTVLVPAEGGTYTEGVVGAPQWPNPVLAAFNETDEDIARLLFRGLTRVDERSRIVPDLAESWQVSGDALVYTFTLKAGLKWQDGAPITADDAVYTFQLMQSPDFPGPPYLLELWKAVQVAKVDALRVQFTLSEPFAPFLDYTTIGLLPQHILAGTAAKDLLAHPFNSSPVGNGPFMLERATSEEIVLRPNPLSDAPKPYLERLALRLYPDTDAVFAAYSRGEVDGIRTIPADRLDEAAELPSLNLYSAPVAEAAWVIFNTQSPPLDAMPVRRALALATDRKRLIADALRGQALPLYGPLLPTSWAYNPAVEEADYDAEQARTLLADAGWADTDGDGIRDKDGKALGVEIACLDTPQDVRVAEALAAQWQEVGARVAVTPLPAGELANDYLRPRAFQAVLYHWLDITPDPDMYPFWHSTQATDPGQNFARFQNRDADEIMEQARRTPDTVLRQELYARLQEILRDEAPAVFLYQPVYTMGVRDTVQGVTLGPVRSASDRFQSIAGWYVQTRRVVASQAR